MKLSLPRTHHSEVKRGFTLVELLVVIGILTVLLAIVLIAINPAKQFAQANNTQRRSDVNAILNATHQYAADNKGTLPPGTGTPAAIDTSARKICGPTGSATCPSATSIDLCASLIPQYLANLPVDPKTGQNPAAATKLCSDATTGDEYKTDYLISRSAANNRITVTATAEAEGSTTPTITVTR